LLAAARPSLLRSRCRHFIRSLQRGLARRRRWRQRLRPLWLLRCRRLLR
jgi:hypothetical protein